MSEQFDPRRTPWNIDESEFCELVSVEEQMRFLLHYAVLAPSGHNRQPWAFRIVPDGVEVFADYSRRMPVVDPEDRELLMSVGAAITNFRVAAAHFGFHTTVRYESRPEESRSVALITASERGTTDGSLAELFRSIPKRHTNRALFDGEPLGPSALSAVCEVTERFADTFCFILPNERNRAVGMIDQAGRTRTAQQAFRADLARWVRANDGQSADGFSADSLGIPQLFSSGAAWFLRQFDFGEWQAPRDRRLAESASALLLVTGEDDRVSLIRTGEALEILLLTITASGLQYSFLNHPVAMESMREQLRTLAGASGLPQLIVRIGFGPPLEEAMPRRELDSAMRVADDRVGTLHAAGTPT
jgi:hypothetical protein